MANYNRLTPYNLLKISAICLLALVGVVSFAQTPNSKKLLDVLKKVNDPDSAQNYGNQLIALAKKHNDPLFEARVLHLRSFQLYKNGDEQQALKLATESNKLTSPVDSFTYVKSATMIAYMLSRRGEDVEALKVAFDILRKADAKGWKSLAADCRICIADLYRSIDKPQQALPYAEQAARDVLSVRDTSMYIFALSTLSNLYSNRGMDSPANLNKAVGYMEIILNKPYAAKLSMFERARYLSNLGRLYELLNKLQKAEVVLVEAIDLCRKGKYPAIEKHALNELSTVKNDQREFHEAIKYANQALAIQADAQSSRINQRNIYRRLRDGYEGLHDYKNAFKYAEKASSLNDSILAQDKAREASELSEKYKLDKRLVETSAATKIARQQRNFIIVLGGILVVAGVTVYRWLSYRRKKEADLLLREKQQLERLDGMKSKFFANISHELRTPLTLIMGPLNEVINRDLSEEHQQKHLQTVWRNSKKLLGMVNELLDLGKIEAGKLPVKLQPVKLKQFIIMLYQGFASAAEHKNVRYSIICNIDDELVADIDREKLEKIINNLLGNAVKYTPAEGAVYVNTTALDNTFEFSVANSGADIHPDDLPHIFERYYQGSREGAMAEGGTGIGLALAKEFTELLGGEIKVENDFGRGTLFRIKIPFSASAAVEVSETEVADVEVYAQLETTVNGGAAIMLVEDHKEMASYITSLLAPNYNVIQALNGTDALEKLNDLAEMPGLIISDVMMPGMDGFTLLKHLKEHKDFYSIPVIMLTALADAENRLTALNTGVDDYLTKPFVSDELLARVNNLLSNAAKRNQPIEESLEPAAVEDEPLQSSPADLLWLAEVEKFVRKNIGKTDLNLTALSYDMAISERQLNRRIKNITGLTPNRYIRAIRLQIAREAIESGRYRTIAEIAYAAGFETPAYFSKLFKEHYGRDVNSLL